MAGEDQHLASLMHGTGKKAKEKQHARAAWKKTKPWEDHMAMQAIIPGIWGSGDANNTEMVNVVLPACAEYSTRTDEAKLPKSVEPKCILRPLDVVGEWEEIDMAVESGATETAT